MGIGSALHEEMIIDNTGKVRNPSFLDYHLVTSLDVPKMIPIIVECAEPEGPYGQRSRRTRTRADTRRHRQRGRRCHWSARLRLAAQAGKRFLGAAEEQEKRAPPSSIISNSRSFSSNMHQPTEQNSSSMGWGSFVGGRDNAGLSNFCLSAPNSHRIVPSFLISGNRGRACSARNSNRPRHAAGDRPE